METKYTVDKEFVQQWQKTTTKRNPDGTPPMVKLEGVGGVSEEESLPTAPRW